MERRLCSGGGSSSSANSSSGSCSGSSCEARRWLARCCPDSMRSAFEGLHTRDRPQLPCASWLHQLHTSSSMPSLSLRSRILWLLSQCSMVKADLRAILVPSWPDILRWPRSKDWLLLDAVDPVRWKGMSGRRAAAAGRRPCGASSSSASSSLGSYSCSSWLLSRVEFRRCPASMRSVVDSCREPWPCEWRNTKLAGHSSCSYTGVICTLLLQWSSIKYLSCSRSLQHFGRDGLQPHLAGQS